MNKFIFYITTIITSFYIHSVYAAEKDFKLDVNLYRQKYEFSCEAAALKVILNYEKIDIQEDEVIKYFPIDPTPRNKTTWGDPDKGFVGDIYGKNAEVSYGIHWQGLKKISQRWGITEAGTAPNSSIIAKYVLQKKPVIAWVVSENASGRDLTWKTANNKTIKAVEGEHTVVVYGFRGDSKNPSGFYIMDPSMGLTYKSNVDFSNSWRRLGNSYLVMLKIK